MSQATWDLIESFIIVAVITAGIIGHALVLARREDRETPHPADNPVRGVGLKAIQGGVRVR